MKKAFLLVVLWLLAGCASAIATSTTDQSQPPAISSTPASPVSGQSYPVTWSGHGLTGHLLLILYQDNGDQLINLDLATGKYQLIFQAPAQSSLNGASLSPDGKQYLLTYSAPFGNIQLGNTDLYLLPVGGNSQPQPLLMRTAKGESYFDASWNKDGTKIIYSHFYQAGFTDVPVHNPVYKFAVESIDLNGHKETLISDAYWPVLSPDNSKISYIFSTGLNSSNDLYIADANGKNNKALTTPGVTPPVDAHLFSKDGQAVYFSMVNPQPQPASFWWENLFGIESVSAHAVPSDWYKVPAQGGKIERITNVEDTGMFGALSPDGSRLVFISSSGLFSVKTDGSDLMKLVEDMFDGTVQWLP